MGSFGERFFHGFQFGSKKRAELTKEEAGETIRRRLCERYGREFEIVTLEKENIGQNFGIYQYKCTMKPAGDEAEAFCARMGLDGEGLRDDFGRLLFGAEAERDVRKRLEAWQRSSAGSAGCCEISCCEQKEGVSKSNETAGVPFRLLFGESKKACHDFEDCRAGHFITVVADLPLSSGQKSVEAAFRLMEDLREAGYYFSLCFHQRGQSRRFIYSDTSPFPSRDEILDWKGEG